jgi:hypothetical protein
LIPRINIAARIIPLILLLFADVKNNAAGTRMSITIFER